MLMLVLLYNLFNCFLLWQQLFRVCCTPFPVTAASFPSVPSQGQQNYLIKGNGDHSEVRDKFCSNFQNMLIRSL